MNIFFIIDIILAYLLEMIFGKIEGLNLLDKYIFPKIKKIIKKEITKSHALDVQVLGKSMIHKPKVNEERDKALVNRIFIKIGVVFSVIVIIITILLSIFSQKLIGNLLLVHILTIYVIYSVISIKKETRSSYSIYKALDGRDLFTARERLEDMIKDNTIELPEEEIIEVVIEKNAKNHVWYVIAPLYYVSLGSFFGLGLLFLLLYVITRKVNEEFNQHGDEEILDRLSYIVNRVPAIIVAYAIVASTLVVNLDIKNSFKSVRKVLKSEDKKTEIYVKQAILGGLGIDPEESHEEDNEEEKRVFVMRDIVDSMKLGYISLLIVICGLAGVSTLISIII